MANRPTQMTDTPRQDALLPLTQQLPDWIPDLAVTYLNHVGHGVPLRKIARAKGIHASTVMRQVRKLELRRDDPLMDEALEQLTQIYISTQLTPTEEKLPMQSAPNLRADDPQIQREARRILRRLCEKDAYLLVAPQLELAAVFRDQSDGSRRRIATVKRDVARAFVLLDWITGEAVGVLMRYTITSVGRAALKRLLSKDTADAGFQDQHRDYAERDVLDDVTGKVARLRYNAAESPLTLLGRKRAADGLAFLAPELVEAGERLREDFEVAQLGPRVAQNWDRFLTAGARGAFVQGGSGEGPAAARERVSAALAALGPGLADIAFRVCCFLEGLEKAEKRLGWSARSGKVVLKISLQRLANHYGLQVSAPERKAG